MARPQKIGLDYFPMDCHLDKNLKAIIRKFGAEGFGVVVGLYQHIYSEGYWVKWCSETEEDFALEMNVDEDVLSSILEFCVKREIFNSTLYNSNKILTSRGIQKRYLNVIERRKCKQLSLYNLVNVDNNPINVDINPVNDNISTQSKVKESKVKKSKEDYNPEDAVKDINEIDDNLWIEWIAHKKKLKLAITQRAVIKNLNKLKKFGLNKANSIIEDSIDSGWKDFYLKDEAGQNKPIQQSHNIANAALIAKAMTYGKPEL